MIYIIRHGQTAKNRQQVLQGRSDLPLNEIGKQQTEAVRDRFLAAGIHFDKVYSSPLIRALETAYIILGKDDPESLLPVQAEVPADIPPVIVDERLIEMDYGPYEGMDLMHPAPEVLAFFKDFVNVPAPDGMEPLNAVIARAGRFLEDIREEAAAGDLLISTHAIAMKGVLEYLTPDSHGRYWSEYVGNCAVFSAEVLPDGTWTVPKIW